jgi:hypothetical protein
MQREVDQGGRGNTQLDQRNAYQRQHNGNDDTRSTGVCSRKRSHGTNEATELAEKKVNELSTGHGPIKSSARAVFDQGHFFAIVLRPGPIAGWQLA